MPLATSLPAPTVEWFGYWYWPTMFPANTPGTNFVPSTEQLLHPGEVGQAFPPFVNIYGDSGVGAGASRTYQMRAGRPCIRNQTTNAASMLGHGIVAPWWQPGTGAASGYNSGALANEGSVVAVVDFHCALASGPTVYGDRDVGFYFAPRVFAGTSLTLRPGAGTTLGGFGIFVVDDGGNASYEYLAWDGVGPNVTEAIAVPTALVPDVTDWSTFRFIIQAASGGREPNLTVQVNGTDLLVDREFGTAQLADLDTMSGAAALQWVPFYVFEDTSAGGIPASMFCAANGKYGRFTPSGQEIQAQ